MEAHYATLWESIADQIGDREAVVCGAQRRIWSDYDERAARLSQAFGEAGLGRDSKVGLYLYNGIEYLEAHYAAFKHRGVPINVNYRYVDDELLYLLDDSDSEALVFHTSLADRIGRVMEKADKVRLWVGVDDGGELPDGAVAFEDLVSAHDPAPRISRAESDVYMLYTGGTTGMPKGVMYDIGGMLQNFLAGGFPLLGLDVPAVDDIAGIARQLWEEGHATTSIPACPLMHGTGVWLGAMIPHCAGARVVNLESRSFDAHELWSATERERATQHVIVGDAFARTMLRALEEREREGRPYDLSSMRFMMSSGAMWTSEVKQALLDWHDFTLIDAMGSTEGSMATQITRRGRASQTAKFKMSPTTRVFSEDGREIEPGSGEAGMVAAGGHVPLGYYKDAKKSATTFKTIAGERFSFPGDWAIVEADGTLTLLGRGSGCINTAGEKVYPEEVEEVVKQHPDVLDCLVVGVDDEKFGQRVTGVAAIRPGRSVDERALQEFARTKLAAFKVPKQLFVVAEVKRAPNGKADYTWAEKFVLESLGRRATP